MYEFRILLRPAQELKERMCAKFGADCSKVVDLIRLTVYEKPLLVTWPSCARCTRIRIVFHKINYYFAGETR